MVGGRAAFAIAVAPDVDRSHRAFRITAATGLNVHRLWCRSPCRMTGATSLRQPGRTPRPAVNAEAIRQIDAILVRRAA